MSGASTSSAHPGRPKATTSPLVRLTKDPRFYWFLGHVSVVFGSLSYVIHSLGLFFSPRTAGFWYRETYTCVVLTFGFVLYGEWASGRLPVTNFAGLLQDTSIQYLLCAILWLFTAPFVGTLPPFLIFSFSHVLNFFCSDLLPIFGHPQKSALNLRIQSFVASNSTQFMYAAANIEFIILLRLLFLVFTFRRSAIIQFVFYILFFKLRYQNSAYTHKVVQVWEIRVDNLISHPSVPPVVKDVWIQAKGYIRLVFGSILGGPAASYEKKTH